MANDEVRIKIKIDSNAQELVLMKQHVQDLGKSFNDTDSFANTFMKRINIAGHIYAGYQVLNQSLGELSRKGIEVNKEFQRLTNSLTMSSAVMIANNDIYGNAITVKEKYRLATLDAAKATELLQKANINTPHTMKQTVQIYDAMYFGMKKVGATTSDMVEITEKLSIAAGNKIGFDAFLSAMDGIATGSVEANSEMGRFLTSVGLTNENIKNSSDVVALFKEQLKDFQPIQDFSTKMSNLSNSSDMFAKNLMKIPFDYLESRLPSIASMFDSWAKSINEINIYLSNASNLNTYDELINKQYQLLGQIKEVKDDKFMWDSDQKEELDKLNSQLDIVFNKLTKIREDEEKLKNTKTTFDSASIDKLVNETLNPYSMKIDEINKKWKVHYDGLVSNKMDTSAVIKAWTKDLEDFNETESEKNKKISDEAEKNADKQKRKLEELNKAYQDISQIGMSDYDKSLLSITQKTQEWQKAGINNNTILIAQGKLLDELNQKTSIALAKEDLSYYERLVQLKSDSLEKDQELAGISYSQKVLDIEDSNRPIAQKEKLIALEGKLYSKTLERLSLQNQASQLDEVSSSYQDMLDSQISLIDATNDWNSNLTGTAASLADIASATGNLSKLNLVNLKAEDKLRTEYEKNKLKFYGQEEKLKELDLKYTKDKAALDKENTSATLIGYSNIAGAISTMFDQGSKEAATFQIAQSALALVEGTRAILTAGTGDPYTAIPRMIAMAAMVSSLLSNIGVAFGMNKESISSDAFSSMEANTGTGSVLGDVSAQSESIKNSLDILENYAQPELDTLLSMNKHLELIASNIGGVTSLLIQQGGFAFGDGYTGFDTGWKNNIDINSGLMGAINPLTLTDKLLDSIGLGFLSGIGSGIVNSILGGVFGKTKTYQSMTDAGIYFANQLLLNAIKEFDGSAYQTIQTTVTKKTWFSKSEYTYINSYFEALDNETERQFSLVLGNLYNTVLEAGNALDSSEAQTANSLENFVVSIGKISLLGKTGDQIQETLEAIFGKIGDDIAKTAFPLLTPFQQIGEGMFETMTRVATGMEVAEYYVGRLGNRFDDVIYTAIGNKQGDIGFEALLQSITDVEKATYPTNNGLLEIVSNLDSTAEELYSAYISLDELRDKLIFLKQEAQGLSSSMIYGAGSVSALDSGFKAYFENFLTENEQLTYKTQQLTEKFNDLGIALPISKDSFKELLSSLDLTTESGKELYGRLIILSEGFAEVADGTKDSIDELKSSLQDLSSNAFDTFISSLEKVGNTITGLKNTAASFIQGLDTASNANLEDQIISYNKLRADFSSYYDENGILKAGANESDVTSLYSRISSLASSIAGKDTFLKESLVAQFSNDILNLNNSEDILKVNIVAGLGNLEGLTEEQKNRVNALLGTTATEETLYSLNEYMKKQLEVLQKTQEQETASLSKSTFTYGDYVGKQEQIDIATALGMSYESAQPLVETLQNLSVSKNKTADIESLLGYSNGSISYNLTAAEQLKTLSPYLSEDISGAIDNVTKKVDFNKRYFDARNLYEKEKNESDLALENYNYYFNASLASKTANYKERAENIATGTAFKRSGWMAYNGTNRDLMMEWSSKYGQEFNQAYSAYKTLLALEDEKRLNGFMYGTSNMIDDQLAMFNNKEIVVPTSFSDGIRQGELSLGNNNKLITAVEKLTNITIQQAREIRQMKKLLEEKSA